MTAGAFLLQQATNITGMTPDQQFALAQEALRQHQGIGHQLEDFLVPLGFFAMVVLLAFFGLRRRRAQMQACFGILQWQWCGWI